MPMKKTWIRCTFKVVTVLIQLVIASFLPWGNSVPLAD